MEIDSAEHENVVQVKSLEKDDVKTEEHSQDDDIDIDVDVTQANPKATHV